MGHVLWNLEPGPERTWKHCRMAQTIQKFCVVDSVESASEILFNPSESNKFSCNECVIEAQVLAGGRGKGHLKKLRLKGSVKLTKDPNEAVKLTGQMLNDHLITHRRTDNGILVSEVVIAEALDIRTECYLAILLDRAMNGPVLVACKFGGIYIEEIVEKDPESIKKFQLAISKSYLDLNEAIKMVKSGLDIEDNEIAIKVGNEITKLDNFFFEMNALQI